MWHKARAIVLGFTLMAGCSTSDGTNSDEGGGFKPGPFDAIGAVPKVTKIDLLLMIDNSSSMADKQAILAQVIPDWVDQIVNPRCIDPGTGRSVGRSVNGTCAAGVLAFAPIKDIHIGVISSSLGGHGATVCDDSKDTRSDPHNNDQGHLISRGVGGTTVPTFGGKGFLFYNPNAMGALGTADVTASSFADIVQGVGQHGCGYEASLESVYRFLVDPDPYSTIRIDITTGGYGQALLNGTDRALLTQRADFLRSDSLVSIMMMTDENDCSITAAGQGFYALLPPNALGRSVLRGGTSKCAENPNDPCCHNCGQAIIPAGCPNPNTDPACAKGELTVPEDQPGIRCFDQKRRYGTDFLFPVQRYIDGFTKDKVPNRKGEMVANPLFADLTCTAGQPCNGLRDKSLVFVAGIVGVPWQAIAVDRSDLTKGYKTAKQIADDGVWADIVGDPQNLAGPVPARDLHMVESIKPRSGLPEPSSSWKADPIHGHEWDPSKDAALPNGDLQYACIFDLAAPRVCDQPGDCDCFGASLAETQSPLCQNEQGAFTTTQTRGKAYPGTRILQVLQGVGEQAIVGSICPAQQTDAAREDFGYRPAIDALLARLSGPLGHVRPWCSSSSVSVDAKSLQAPCVIIEVFDAPSCNCDGEPGRRTARDDLLTPEMKAAGSCRCEIVQLSGTAQSDCRTAAPGSVAADGWCYVNPAQFGGRAACNATRHCPPERPNGVRFNTAKSEPRIGATTVIRCHDWEPPYFPPVCL